MSITIEEVRSIRDPQRSYKWKVTLPPPNNFLSDSTIKKQNTLLSKASRVLNRVNPQVGSVVQEVSSFTTRLNLPQLSTSFTPSLYVEEVQGLPFAGVEREEFYEAGRNVYFPSNEDTPPVTLVFYVDQSNNITNYINWWKRAVVNVDGIKGLPVEYKAPILVELLDGTNLVVDSFRLLGCYPTATTPYNLNQESGRLTLIQDFSVDRVEHLPIDSEAIEKKRIENRLINKGKSLLDPSLASFSNLFS